ncbi:MAG: ParB/RepB/Spo0J family partition protein [Gammaproteobacteria bacterium]|nr:ParB/RepB/Spo0J family partition protein [Gammaproteobacteria bacterium]
MSARNPLGKGLESLLGDISNDQSKTPTPGVMELPIGSIVPNPDQPRQDFNEESIASLAESLKQQGVMQPLIVRADDNGSYQLISGERRWRAAQLAGLLTVPVLEREATASEMLVLGLVENLQREDLSPYDAAVAMQKLIEDHGLSQGDIAQALGKSPGSVSNALRLLRLDKRVLELLRKGQLEEATARTLLSLELSAQFSVAQKVIKKGLSVRQTEALVKRHGRAKTVTRKDADVVRLQDELADSLGAEVTISQRAKRGGGYLRIQYRNLAQLQTIIDRIKA